MKKLILASGSPQRKALLEQLGVNFSVVKSNIEETYPESIKLDKVAEYLSKEKAKAVQKKHPKDIIIAADTTIVLENQLYSKPNSKGQAKEYLKSLSGKQHLIITGLTVLCKDKEVTVSQSTKVLFKNISEKEIDTYLNTDEPMDKAGAYAIQGKGRVFVEKIEGDYSNAVGLPINLLAEILENFGVKVKKNRK